MPIQLVTFNVKANSAEHRYETIDGKRYLVVPCVMMNEGVHRGTEGPVLYRGSVLSRFPEADNNKPVVNDHPKDKSGKMTTFNVETIESQQFGFLMNCSYVEEGKKRIGEAFIDEDKANRIDKRIVQRIMNGKMTELSTGYSAEVTIGDGVFNGESYKYEATELHLDHLAVLLDTKGACSIAKGAGFLRNSDPESERLFQWLSNESKVVTVIDNALSFSDIGQMVNCALSEKFGEKGKTWEGYAVDVFDDMVVYRTHYSSDKLYSLKYTIKGGQASLIGEPAEVQRKYNYVTKDGKLVGNQSTDPPNPQENVSMNPTQIKEHVNSLIVAGMFNESERDALEKMAPELLAKIKAPVPTKINNQEPPVPTPASFDYNQWLKTAPVELQSFIGNSVDEYKEKCTKAITTIKASVNNTFTDEELQSLAKSNPGQLIKMAKMSVAPAAAPENPAIPSGGDFWGLIGGLASPIQLNNTAGDVPKETLDIPGGY